ncbi:MAG: response regulator [Lysobacterales bacterium]|jgi:two-component system chemotaxis response regulator CheY
MAKILVVDDAQIMVRILQRMLEKAGHDVVGVAYSGREALDMYKRMRPDLVTLDIQMPGGDGLSCLEDIRAIDRDAIVIMVTALGRGPAEEESREKGASGYLVKPFQPEQLYEVIDHCLSDHEQGGWSH